MQSIINKYEKQWGYKPTTEEIYNAFSDGELILTDAEENALHAELEALGLI